MAIDVNFPFLLIRSNVVDTGVRPTAGVFWESPDITLVSGVSPQDAPQIPPDFDGTAQVDVDNTVYARIWNLGAAAAAVKVEFYWFNPTIGINEDAAHLIGSTVVGVRSSSHAVVRCPVAWRARFVNGGHECLVVRVSQPASDPLGQPAWNASMNRHVAQRNIHVIQASGNAETTIRIQVALARGLSAHIAVSRADVPSSRLRNGCSIEHAVWHDGGDHFGLTCARAEAHPVAGRALDLGAPAEGDYRAAAHSTVVNECEPVVFATSDKSPGPGRSHVYRINGYSDGRLFGGYTVVMPAR
jgi:hypothetical protein